MNASPQDGPDPAAPDRPGSGRMTPARLALRITLAILVAGSGVTIWYLIQRGPHVLHPRTPPPFVVPVFDPAEPSVRFCAIGDQGSGDADQQAVGAGMAAKARESGLDLIVLLGDNFYSVAADLAADSERFWRTRFENMYDLPELDVPFFATLGNVDYKLDVEGLVERTEAGTRWVLPERYYTFSVPLGDESVQFFALDTVMIHCEEPGHRDQIAWLASELQRSTARWKIAFGHHPLRSSGDHGGSPLLQLHVEPLFLEYGVSLYLCGHDHHLAVMQPIDDLNLVISGAGGRHPTDVEWTDDVIYARAGLGFTWVRVGPDQLTIELFDEDADLAYCHVVPWRPALDD